jgi:hypothetical protein
MAQHARAFGVSSIDDLAQTGGLFVCLATWQAIPSVHFPMDQDRLTDQKPTSV